MINSNAILEVNTKNLIKNFKSLSKIAKNSTPAATIKANAYGIGDKEVFKLLYKNGCRHFFLATIEEALNIRKFSSKGFIYVLNGLENNKLGIFNKFNLIPILNSISEIKTFIKNKHYSKKLKIGIHIDTGLNRLGIAIEDLISINIKNMDLFILISHLASADEMQNSYSKIQNKKFQSIFNIFKSIKFKSLSNSAGILQNNIFHYDIIRPGISLYGGYNSNHLNKKIKFKPVVKLKGKILQIKIINKNEYVGYNQTYKTKRKTKIAIIAIGYADGIARLLSNNGHAYFKKENFKIIGRISMDSITVDITKSKKNIKVGEYMELINEKNNIQKIAKNCGTISNEVLTSISKRVKRVYI